MCQFHEQCLHLLKMQSRIRRISIMWPVQGMGMAADMLPPPIHVWGPPSQGHSLVKVRHTGKGRPAAVNLAMPRSRPCERVLILFFITLCLVRRILVAQITLKTYGVKKKNQDQKRKTRNNENKKLVQKRQDMSTLVTCSNSYTAMVVDTLTDVVDYSYYEFLCVQQQLLLDDLP
ncbi:hypothetical protein Cni_G16395 [Canna indica]|uniref:Uncharacterized protein n=1 Tax=Canna indica TaxID=4628 RepID=A0AAQ3QGR2_9LILI|nr:hypothetical protein Cni_G16395 [Canna indica]